MCHALSAGLGPKVVFTCQILHDLLGPGVAVIIQLAVLSARGRFITCIEDLRQCEVARRLRANVVLILISLFAGVEEKALVRPPINPPVFIQFFDGYHMRRPCGSSVFNLKGPNAHNTDTLPCATVLVISVHDAYQRIYILREARIQELWFF